MESHIGERVSQRYIKWEDLRPAPQDFAEGEQADGHWKLEAAWAARAGIEVKNALASVEVGDVGVAEEDGSEFAGGRVKVERVQVVEHVDVAVRNEDHIGFGEFAAGAGAVDVAADRGDGGDFGQLFEDRDLPNVAEVQDTFDACKGLGHLGAVEAGSVADDADFHLEAQFQPRARVELAAQRVAEGVEAEHGDGEQNSGQRVKGVRGEGGNRGIDPSTGQSARPRASEATRDMLTLSSMLADATLRLLPANLHSRS